MTDSSLVKRGKQSFLRTTPKIAILGSILVIAAVAALFTAGMRFVLGMSTLWPVAIAVILVFVSALAWGAVLSQLGMSASDGREFPLNFGLWLLRPPGGGEPDAAFDPRRDLRYGPLYLVGLAFLAVVRAFSYFFFDRVLQPGDVIGMRAPWRDEEHSAERYVVAEVVESSEHEVVVQILERLTGRPRTFRPEYAGPVAERCVLARSEFDELDAKLIWRGERRFWRRDDYAGPDTGWSLSLIRPRYAASDAIVEAGVRVDEAPTDPKAFARPPIPDPRGPKHRPGL